MRKSEVLIVILAVLALALGIYFYPQMPAKMASHWNSAGQVDGYMQKFWGLFLMPIILVVMTAMFMVIPCIDPLKKNIEKFRIYFDVFIVLLSIFLLYIYILTLLWNGGYMFNMTLMMVPALAVLFYYVGVLTENAKRNWFIGIRTPWTLTSDKVWEKTHKIGGKMFKASAIIAIIGIFFGDQAIWFLLVPVLFTTFFTMIYSLILFNKLNKK